MVSRLPRKERSVRPSRCSKVSSTSIVNRLFRKLNSFRSPRYQKTSSGNVSRKFPFKTNSSRPRSSSKSPCFKVLMSSSSILKRLINSNSSSVTFAQLLSPVFFMISSRTCGVRSHTGRFGITSSFIRTVTLKLCSAIKPPGSSAVTVTVAVPASPGVVFTELSSIVATTMRSLLEVALYVNISSSGSLK